MSSHSESASAAALSIANMAFEVESHPPLRWSSWQDVYAPFLESPAPDADLRVPVSVRRGLLPPPAGAQHLFDGGRSWAVWRAGAERFLMHAPRGPAHVVWTARCTPDTASPVQIGCSDALMHVEAQGATLECPLRYPLDQILLMYLFARRRGLLVHAAGVVLDGRLFVLAGRSGAGKSTVSGLLVEHAFGMVLSDDRLVLREQGGRWMGYGTPWPGTARLARAGGAPIAGILFLEHGHANVPERLAPAAALHALLPLASILWHERDLVAPMTDAAAALVAQIPVYRFAFTPDARAVSALAAFMKG